MTVQAEELLVAFAGDRRAEETCWTIYSNSSAFNAMVETLGLTIQGVYYTVGQYDTVAIVEGSDESATAALLKVNSFGNVKTQILRAFSVAEMRKIIDKMP